MNIFGKKQNISYCFKHQIYLKNILIKPLLLIILFTLMSCRDFECGSPHMIDSKYLSINSDSKKNDSNKSTYRLKAYKMIDPGEQTGAYSCRGTQSTQESVPGHTITVYFCATNDVGIDIPKPSIEDTGKFDGKSEEMIEIEQAELVTFILTEPGERVSTEYKTFFKGKGRYTYDDEERYWNEEDLQWVEACHAKHNITKY